MDVTLVVLRLLHVVCGVYWAGTIMFFATLLEPTIREAGPSGGQIMQGLMRRHFLNIIPIMAVLTVLSGIDLMRRVSAGFEAAWFSSSVGMTFSIGGLAAIVGLAIGVGIMRPAAVRMMKLGKEVAANPDGQPNDSQMAESARLRRRSQLALRAVASLLTVAVVSMAVARYM